MELSVRVLCECSGELLCTLAIHAGATVQELKSAINTLEGTDAGCQNISLAGRLLCDGEVLAEAVAKAAQQDDDEDELVLDLIDVTLLRVEPDCNAQAGDTGDLQDEDSLSAENVEEGSTQNCDAAAELSALRLDDVTLGLWVQIMEGPAQVHSACSSAGLDAEDSARWQAAAGCKALVVATDPIDGTVEVKVPALGDLWLPLDVLLRLPGETSENAGSSAADQAPQEEGRPEGGEVDTAKEHDLREEEQRRAEEEADHWAVDRLDRLRKELIELDSCAPADRRSRLRALQLELHPDKQTPARRPRVQPLFLLVQREWESSEAAQKARQQPQESTTHTTPRHEPRERQNGCSSHFGGAKPGRPAGPRGQAESAAVPLELSLRIRLEGGGSVTLVSKRSSIVYDLKEALEAQSGLPPNTQELLRGHEKLDDADFLAVLPNVAVVELVQERRPPAPGSAFAEKVRRHWRMLQHAPPGSKADRTVVLAAVRQCGLALQHAAPELRADRRLVLLAATKNWQALEFADPRLQDDFDIVLSAVKQDWRALQFAGAETRGDLDLVAIAVEQSWEALQHAAPALRGHRELMLSALQQSGLAIGLASPALQADRDLAWVAVRQDGNALQHLADALRDDREVALAAVRQNGAALAFASDQARSDRDFVLQAVWNNGAALRFVSDNLRGDKQVALAACGETPKL